MDHLSVNLVHLCQLTKIEPSRSLDEVSLGSVGIRITKGGDDDCRNVDELSIDLKTSGGRSQLGFESMRRRTKDDQCLGQFENERLPLNDV